jgi:hypothetical protein
LNKSGLLLFAGHKTRLARQVPSRLPHHFGDSLLRAGLVSAAVAHHRVLAIAHSASVSIPRVLCREIDTVVFLRRRSAGALVVREKAFAGTRSKSMHLLDILLYKCDGLCNDFLGRAHPWRNGHQGDSIDTLELAVAWTVAVANIGDVLSIKNALTSSARLILSCWNDRRDRVPACLGSDDILLL